MLNAAMLKQIMPALPREKAEEYLPFLVDAMREFKINNELRISAFLAQLAHESMQLTRWVENLNYSARRLTQVWPNRFPDLAIAQQFANNPQKLANRVYNGRMGNRTGSGDGWLYRGRGPMQATGREMYELLSRLLGLDLVANPELLLDKRVAFRAAAAIFAIIKNCNPLADALITTPNNFTLITKRINGGTNGLNDRLDFYRRARRVLPDNIVLQGENIIYVGQIATVDTVIEADILQLDSDHLDLLPDSPSIPPENPSVLLSDESEQADELNLQPVQNPTAEPCRSEQPAPGTVLDKPEDPPRHWISVEDVKPFILKWLRRIWGGFGVTNITQFSSVTTFGAKYGGEYWWIFPVIGVLIFLFLLTVAFVASIILGVIWWKNRGEIKDAKELVAESRRNPNMFNLGLIVEKKGLKREAHDYVNQMLPA